MPEVLRGGLPIEKNNRFPRQPIRIGCAGWNIPQEAKANFIVDGSHLERYSQTLSCCEIDSSFYRPHKNVTWERWASIVPAEFRFSVKAPRAITHEARLNCSSEILLTFLQQISYLDGKRGPVLIQLPPSFEFDYEVAKRFLSLLRSNYAGDVVWEPRHSSWFDNQAMNLLKQFKIARVAADPACVPVASRPGGIARLVYFRLHGSPRLYYSAYSDQFLNELAAQLNALASTAQVWCIFDNTASGFAIQNALELSAKIKILSAPADL